MFGPSPNPTIRGIMIAAAVLIPSGFASAAQCESATLARMSAIPPIQSDMPFLRASYPQLDMPAGREGTQAVVPASDVVESASADFDLNTWTMAVRSSGLDATLKGEGPFTVFAPTNQAFAAVPRDRLGATHEHPGGLAELLSLHIVHGRLGAGDIARLGAVETLQGQPLEIDTADGVRVNGARVLRSDIVAGNGIVHVIDQVIVPN
jgi:uncharacterized surface protein with fasciclin (FAS1) repeats